MATSIKQIYEIPSIIIVWTISRLLYLGFQLCLLIIASGWATDFSWTLMILFCSNLSGLFVIIIGTVNLYYSSKGVKKILMTILILDILLLAIAIGFMFSDSSLSYFPLTGIPIIFLEILTLRRLRQYFKRE